MSALVDRAIEGAGFGDIAAARRDGDIESVRRAMGRLADADLLVLGALADHIRREEVGDVVQVFANAPGDQGPDVIQVPKSDGLAYLRALAVARITGPRAARVRVDWDVVGLELAQVALGFGASELAGRIASKRGLPIADGEMSGSGKRSAMQPMQLVKKRELAGFIERSGRRAVFVGEEAS